MPARPIVATTSRVIDGAAAGFRPETPRSDGAEATTAAPTTAPTATCPSWATRDGCPADCACCAAYGEVNQTLDGFDPAATGQCLVCEHGFRCVDDDGDGDGECVSQDPYHYNGTNARRGVFGFFEGSSNPSLRSASGGSGPSRTARTTA